MEPQVVTFVAIYSSPSLRDLQLKASLGRALATLTIMKLKSVRCDPHEQCESCLVHNPDVCLSSADPLGALPSRN
jgi:hypothetical protein